MFSNKGEIERGERQKKGGIRKMERIVRVTHTVIFERELRAKLFSPFACEEENNIKINRNMPRKEIKTKENSTKLVRSKTIINKAMKFNLINSTFYRHAT